MERKYVWAGLFLAATVFGALSAWRGGSIFPFGICGYLLVSLVPGAALYILLSREPDLLECVVAATALSPVLTTAVAVVGMLAGLSVRAASLTIVVLAGVTGLMAVSLGRGPLNRLNLTRNHAFALLALVLGVCAVTSFLPLTRVAWRTWSDAWFHAAVVAQIKDFGIPPQDPYAAGLQLQYMWFFHVFVGMLSRASGIGPFVVMTLMNVHALIAFSLAAFLFSSLFKREFLHNYASTLTVLFGLNALFWAFLPIKLLAAFIGEVRGADEVNRLLSLRPFDYVTAGKFTNVWASQGFLLGKFMVSTAFTLGLALMAVLWFAGTRYVRRPSRDSLVVASLAAFGAIAFHTVVGLVAFGGLMGGLFLLLALKGRFGTYESRPVAILLLALAASGVLLAPYLHSVTHAKTGAEAPPFGFSAWRLFAIAVPCALAIFLAAFQTKRLVHARDAAARLLLGTTVCIFGICAILNLPESNAYDKFSFLVIFPIAIVGGWTIADFSNRGRSPRGSLWRFVLTNLAAFAPLNLFMLAAYYHTTLPPSVSVGEEEVAAWVRANTSRDSIMIDADKQVYLLVEGPRRYYLASSVYAEAWGYDRAEIARRRRVIDDIYSPGPLDTLTLGTLGSMPSPVYVIARKDAGAADPNRFERIPEIFEQRCSTGEISLFEVDRSACRRLSGSSADHRRAQGEIPE